MFDADCVKASVVDIVQKYDGFPAGKLAVDANVLYFFFYDNFRGLYEAGNDGIPQNRAANYSKAIKRALRENVKLYTTHSVYGEVLATMEFSELEILRRTDPNLPGIDKFQKEQCKSARYDYRAQVPAIRQRLIKLLAAAQQVIPMLPNLKSPDYTLEESAKAWAMSLSDYPDSVLVASSRFVALSHVLSDDCDIATHPDLTVYTANKRTVDAARIAGKLLNR